MRGLLVTVIDAARAIGPGQHTVTFKWVNHQSYYKPYGEREWKYAENYNRQILPTLQVKDFVIREARYDERADLNRDNKITAEDVEKFQDITKAYREFQLSDINRDGMVDAKDERAYEQGPLTSNHIADQVLTIKGVDYQVKYHSDKRYYRRESRPQIPDRKTSATYKR